MDIESYFQNYRRNFDKILGEINVGEIEKAIAVLIEAQERARTIYIAGNGGSAMIAAHFTVDFLNVNRPFPKVKPFRAINLAENQAILTGFSNDANYEKVFEIQLEKLLQPGDVLVAISASGSSPNILRAVDLVNRSQGTSVGVVGFDGGELKHICHHCIHVPSRRGDYGPVEDAFLFLGHLMTAWIAEKTNPV